MRLLIAGSIHRFALLALIALGVGQLGSLHWFAELFSHFVPHYALIFAAAVVLCRGRKRLLWLICSICVVTWMLQPLSVWRQSGNTPAQRLIWYNAHLDNPRAEEESVRLMASGADVVALAEVHTGLAGWQALREYFPYGCEHRVFSPFALMLRARTPLADCEIHHVGEFPYIRAEQTDGIVLYALHPPPPIHAALAQARHAYLQHMTGEIAQEAHVLVVGDLNATPYSPLMRQFVRDGALQFNTLYLTPTWQPFFLNIDHILSRNITARNETLAWQSSDHRPMAVNYGKENSSSPP